MLSFAVKLQHIEFTSQQVSHQFTLFGWNVRLRQFYALLHNARKLLIAVIVYQKGFPSCRQDMNLERKKVFIKERYSDTALRFMSVWRCCIILSGTNNSKPKSMRSTVVQDNRGKILRLISFYVTVKFLVIDNYLFPVLGSWFVLWSNLWSEWFWVGTGQVGLESKCHVFCINTVMSRSQLKVHSHRATAKPFFDVCYIFTIREFG